VKEGIYSGVGKKRRGSCNRLWTRTCGIQDETYSRDSSGQGGAKMSCKNNVTVCTAAPPPSVIIHGTLKLLPPPRRRFPHPLPPPLLYTYTHLHSSAMPKLLQRSASVNIKSPRRKSHSTIATSASTPSFFQYKRNSIETIHRMAKQNPSKRQKLTLSPRRLIFDD